VHGQQELLACGVFTLAALTDRLDGYLARKYGLITTTGMLLDPLADKLLIASALIALVQFNPAIVKSWMAIVIIAREVLVTDLRTVAAADGLTIQARSLGKVKMGVQVVAVIAAILDRRWGNVGFAFDHLAFRLSLHLAAELAIWAAVILSVISASDYFAAFWTKIDEAAKSRRLASSMTHAQTAPQATTIR
jgi:CDP-diacylglycerol--glycerol-3-phosphate 3-phosphatidyltransferase